MADDKVQLVIEVDAKQAEAAVEKFGSTADKASKKADTGFSALSGVFNGVTAAITVAVSAFSLLRSGINGAVEESKLTRQIEASLLATGEASQKAVDGVIEFANALKLATNVDDDLIKSTYIVAKSFGVTSEEAQKLTSAAIDLAAATGIDVETAVRQLGGTVDGTIGKIGNLGADFRNLTTDQLKAGAAIDLVAEKFGGSAAKAVDTYEGRVAGLSNAWGDFTKAIGGVVVDSGILQTTLKATTSIIDNLSSKLSEFKSGNLAITGANILRGTGSMEDLALLRKELEALPAADFGKTSQEITGGLQGILDQAVGSTKAVSTFEEQLKSLIPNELPGKIGLTGKELEDFNKKLKDLKTEGDKFASGILGSFGSQTETEANKASQAILSVEEMLKKGALSAQTAGELKLLIATDFNDKIAKANQDLNDKILAQDKDAADREAAAEEKRQTVYEKLGKERLEFDKKTIEESAKNSAAISKGIGFVGQGKEGAKPAAAAAIGAVAGAVLGPQFGPIIEGVVNLLSNGKVAGTLVREFLKALPEIFLGLADAIPEIMAAIVETVFTPEFLTRLAFGMGKALIAVFTFGLLNFVPEWARKISEELSKYVDLSGSFKPLIEAMERLGNIFSGGGGGGVGGFVGKVKSVLGLSEGGVVPLYAASGAFVPRGTDTVPAMLTPGERVLSTGTTGNLDAFMVSQSSGQSQTMAVLSAILGALQAPIVVNAEAKVNQSAFADIILQLNRQNMRLAV